jgi:hypothetical protein
MAKPNYQFEKRQREMEKKRKKAEKAQKKTSPSDEPQQLAVAQAEPTSSPVQTAE